MSRGRDEQAAAPPQVILYGRPGCHLCEQALERLIELGRQHRFRLVEVDIESDERLHRELLERIPVVEIDGAEVSDLVLDEDAVRARLATFV